MRPEMEGSKVIEVTEPILIYQTAAKKPYNPSASATLTRAIGPLGAPTSQ